MSGRDDSDDVDDEEDEWRFSLSDLDDEDPEGADGETPDEEKGSGSVAGSFAPSEAIEPGDIDPENALFVLVGVALGLGVIGAYALALL